MIPRKSQSASNIRRNQPASNDGNRPPAGNIADLETRRGSLPLAQLKDDEEEFFSLVEAGSVGQVEKFMNDHRSLNINCINYKGQSALHIAIKKENERMVEFLFRRQDLDIRDASLHAVETGNIELTTLILDFIKRVSPQDEMRGCPDSTNYSPDITPLILAAHSGNYKMVRMLLDRGHDIEKPHPPNCLCQKCKETIQEAGSSLSRMRLNAYKALCNPSYICQITDDPIYHGFVLDRELKECALLDKEFRAEYGELAQETREFTVSLLSMCRDTSEIELLMKWDWGYEGTLEKIPFPRLQLALDYIQKEFVAHSMVQTVLTSYWLGEFRSWPRLNLLEKSLRVLLRMILLPFICIGILYIPQIKILKKWRAPLNRYLMSLASYILFVIAVFLLNYLDTGNFNRGPPSTGFEFIVLLYVVGFIWTTIRQLFIQGARRFFRIPWNWYDMVMEFLFVLCFILWMKSYFDAEVDREQKKKNTERKFWNKHDATLLHQGFFAIATILAFGKFAYFCLQSSRLGPLQVSLGKMAIQISYFLIFCFLIITCFAVPMARSYAYYSGMTQTNKDKSRTQLSSFDTFSDAFLTFFWAMFCMSPVESTDVVISNLGGDPKNPVLNSHDFTESIGRLIFATFELMMVIALLNTLIAILSNTFQRVEDNSDVEFKFARAKLWTQFFHESTIVPSPFNLIPSPYLVLSCFNYCRAMSNSLPGAKAKFSCTRCCYIEYEKEPPVDTVAYQGLMSSLVQRYFMAAEEADS